MTSPGALIRAQVSRRSPLARGVGRFAYAFYESRYLMAANGAPAPVRYPAAGTEDFFVSGYAAGAAALARTPAVVDERVGRGRTVAFGFEPNFRAFTNGTQVLLRNAILGPDPRPAGAGGPSATAARRSVRVLGAAGATVELVVAARGERGAARILRRQGLRYRVRRADGRTAFAIAANRHQSGDEIPWARDVESALRASSVPVAMYRVG